MSLKKMEVFNLKSLHVIVTNLEDTYTTNKYTCQVFCIIKIRRRCTVRMSVLLTTKRWEIKPTYILKKTSGSRERRWTKCRFRDYAFSNWIFTKRKRKYKVSLSICKSRNAKMRIKLPLPDSIKTIFKKWVPNLNRR